MFARSRELRIGSQVVARTPLLCPSFSSKGFPDVRKILNLMSEFITESVLVSAYDIHYKKISQKRVSFPELIFIDCGGYETRVDHDLSEAYGREHKPKPWSRRHHLAVMKQWRVKTPTVAVSYDSPKDFLRVKRQISKAKNLQHDLSLPVTLLIKPETSKDTLVSISSVTELVNDLRSFFAVGFTEKEIDHSLMGRMTKIAQLRRAMDSAEVDIPIHIFGSLDTVSTPLYFICGAEIFDGLTWLRFGYHEGFTVYIQNYGAIREPDGLLRKPNDQIFEMWKNNYYYLLKLKDQMINYVRTGDFKAFQFIGVRLEEAHNQLQARITS